MTAIAEELVGEPSTTRSEPREGRSDPCVGLVSAVSEGVGLMTWEQDGFAYADSFDESAGRYRGLRRMEAVSLADADSAGLVVRPEVANRQLAAETAEPPGGGEGAVDVGAPEGTPEVGRKTPPPGPSPPAKQQPKRFHGTVSLDSSRVGRDASRIADEVIAHLGGLVGAKVTVTLEISADIPAGVPDHVVRTVRGLRGSRTATPIVAAYGQYAAHTQSLLSRRVNQMTRFTLQPRKWYACELIGDEFS